MRKMAVIFSFFLSLFLAISVQASDDLLERHMGDDSAQYCLIAALGRGAHGLVVKASFVGKESDRQTNPPEDMRGDTEVAIKLPIDARNNVTTRSLKAIEDEIKILSKLKKHKVRHVPKLRKSRYDAQAAGGKSYYSMDLIKGKTLDQIDFSQMSLDQVIGIYLQVAETLEDLHRVGIIHRDIKPENIMIDEEGRVTVIDFGVALDLNDLRDKEIRRDPFYNQPLEPYEDYSSTLLGTPYFLPGSYVEGIISYSIDVHALAVSIYVNLLRRWPTDGRDTNKVFENKVANRYRRMPFRPPSARYDHLAYLKLRKLIHSALGKREDTPSAREFKEQLKGILDELKRGP